MSKRNPATPDPQTPGGVEKIPGQNAQDSAAGAVLSPPEAVDGGRAEKMDDLDLADAMSQVAEAARAFVEAYSAQLPAIRRALAPIAQAAREFHDRTAAAYDYAVALRPSDGGQESPDSGAETSDGVEAGGQEPLVAHPGDTIVVAPEGDGAVVRTEVSADATVLDADGNEVDR